MIDVCCTRDNRTS